VIDAGLEVDGIWGGDTRAKVEEFQSKFGLEPDGVVGPKTKAELNRQFTLARLNQE
jgi:peptidoglycan hydrolase-like protein with peptidoglycan-binding domain